MNRLTVHVVLASLAWLVAAEPLRAASVNPFDPMLSPDIHAFASCNFEVEDRAEQSASCTHAAIEEIPTTLTQLLGVGDAASDLGTGTLTARSAAQAYRYDTVDLRAHASSVAQLYETIRVEEGFAGRMEIRMTVSGSMLSSMAGGSRQGQVIASLWAFDDQGGELGTASIWIDQYSSGGVYESSRFSYGKPAEITTNADDFGNFDPNDIEVTISMFFDLLASDPEFTFGARLATSSGFGFFIVPANEIQTNTADFSNGARLSVIPPPSASVAWTSSSGVFLPEPSVAALLGAGCLALGGLGRRRGIP